MTRDTAKAGVGRSLGPVRRLVVKVGSSSLTSRNTAIDEAQVGALVAELAAVRKQGCETVLVSSGAIAAGLGTLGFSRRPSDMPSLQASASVGQGLLVHAYHRHFARRKVPVGQVLLTQDDFIRRKGYLNARAALLRLLELGVIPIVNENDTVAVDEIRFGDNDRLAALVANLIHADLLVILSDVDGLYSADPKRHRAALLHEVEDVEDLDGVHIGKAGSSVGLGGMTSKVEAARIATKCGVGVVIANARRPGVLSSIVAGERVGTYFTPRSGRGSSRKLWIGFARTPRGTIFVDAGAKDALILRGKSLLPAGVTGSRGSFAVGDTVEVAGPDEVVFAKGLVNYAQDEIGEIKGRSIRAGGREIVHRDSLVIL